jgi:hypothetical protein
MNTNHCPDNLERIQIQFIRPWPAHAARCVYLPTTRVPNPYATMVRSRLAETMVNRGDDPWNSRHIPRRVEVLLLGAREVAAEQLVRVMLVKRLRPLLTAGGELLVDRRHRVLYISAWSASARS